MKKIILTMLLFVTTVLNSTEIYDIISEESGQNMHAEVTENNSDIRMYMYGEDDVNPSVYYIQKRGNSDYDEWNDRLLESGSQNLEDYYYYK